MGKSYWCVSFFVRYNTDDQIFMRLHPFDRKLIIFWSDSRYMYIYNP